MWIFTNQGFISAVRHHSQPDLMVIRARARHHLEALFPHNNVHELAGADYPFRVFATQAAFAEWCKDQAEQIDYPDFKSSLSDDDYHDVCAQIWEVAHDLQR